MSQLSPQNCKESAWQYCNYGYDKTKYSSFNDCMKGELKKCDNPIDVKYILTENYTAGIFQEKDEPVISIAREFKKGQVIDGDEKTNATGKRFIVLDDNFAVPIGKTRKYTDVPIKQNGFKINRNDVIVGIIAILVIAIVISD